jgi:hypothetical protein
VPAGALITVSERPIAIPFLIPAFSAVITVFVCREVNSREQLCGISHVGLLAVMQD